MIMCLVIDEWTTKLMDTPSKTSHQPHLFPKIKKTSPMTKTKKLQNQLTWTWLPLRPMSSWHTLSVSVHSNASKPHPLVAHIERKHAHNVLQLSKELHIPNLSILLSHFILKQQQSANSSCDNPDNPNYPWHDGKIRVFNSTSTLFYVPSDISGICGMWRKFIRSTLL